MVWGTLLGAGVAHLGNPHSTTGDTPSLSQVSQLSQEADAPVEKRLTFPDMDLDSHPEFHILPGLQATVVLPGPQFLGVA